MSFLHRRIATASTNAVSIQAGRTRLRAVLVSNGSSTVHHLKVYNKGSAPTVGTDTPLLTINCGAAAGAGPVLISFPCDTILHAGLAFAITGGVNSALDSDATSATANVVTVHLFYGDD